MRGLALATALVVAFGLLFAAEPRADTSDLVAAYAFDEGAGTTTADLSGNSNVGTLEGATWTTAGKFGGALTFSGGRVRVADSASLDLTTGATIEAWVYPSQAQTEWRTIVQKERDSYLLHASNSSGALRPAAGVTVGGATSIATDPTAVPVATWTHLALTYDGTQLRLYRNGVQVGVKAASGPIQPTASPLWIGNNSPYGEDFQGRIDEVRVYRVALSPAEIQADMGVPLGGPPDTTVPSGVSGLAASAVSSSRVDVSWLAASDNVGVTGYEVERCQGAGCSSFGLVTTVATLSWSDTGRSPGTSYSYRVRARDAAGNRGAYSSVVSVVTPAAVDAPPSAPSSLVASASGSTGVGLSWSAATDDLGVSGYEVERCQGSGCSGFVQVGTTASTSFADSGLVASTSYSYRVRARDTGNQVGPYSNVASATTGTAPPPPSSSLVAAYSFDEGSGGTVGDASGNGNAGQVGNATWTTSGKYGKALDFNGSNARVTVADAPSLRLSAAMTLEAWVYPTTVNKNWRDVVYKGNDNYYLMATSTNASRPAAGGTFGGVNVDVLGPSAISVNTWTHLAATYDGAFVRLYVNGTQVVASARTGAIAGSANPLQIGGDSLYGQHFRGRIDEVRVYRVALSPAEIQADMGVPLGGPPDTTVPSGVSGLAASAVSSSRVDVSWLAASDNVGVTGYEVERCQGAGCSSFGLVTTVATLSWSDTGRSPGTSYSYRVRARDAAGNRGAYSSVVSVVTPAAVDAPPSAPSSLVASASGSTGVGLSWSAATDDLGVSGYEVERCQGSGCSGFVQVGTTASTSFADSGLVASTSYSYRVRARDTGNQVGPYSNVASATTGTAPPPPSSSLVAAYSFDEGSGGTVGDASGNGNAGQVGNATWTTSGKYGKALSFGGSAKVQVPDSPSLDLTTGATVEAWVYPQASQNGWRAIVQKQVDSYLLHASSGAGPLIPAAAVTVSGSVPSAFAPSALPIGAWTHLAMTYDGSRVRLYVNGVQESSVPATGPILPTGSPLWIGGNEPYDEDFNGRVDEVRIYRTVLSQPEIQADMAIPITPDPNAPKLVITAPAEGATTASGTVNVTYTTTGVLTGVDHVHFQVDADTVNMDLSLDGTYALKGVHVGAHTLKGWLVRADHTKIPGTDAAPVHFSNVVDPADPSPPTVSLSQPAGGSTVSGAIDVTASAADNVGVYGVQLKLDGAALGVEDVVAPYTVGWDTTLAGNGAHVLTAIARDAAGNERTSSPVTVTVSNNGADPALVGSWGAPVTLPIVPVHTSMLPNGKLLIFDTETNSSTNPRVWDPVANTFTQVPYNNVANLFCAGHTPLPDGRILVAGGHINAYVGLKNTTIFNPATNTWADVQPMHYGRWYPTVTTLPDGRMLVVSGASDCPDCDIPGATHAGIVSTPEIFDPASNTWSVLTGADLKLPLYPHMYVLPDGRVFAASTAEDPIASRVLDLTTHTWSVVDGAVREGGSSVMYLPGKILKTGKTWNPDYPAADATAEAWAIDMNQVAPSWQQVSSMAFPRTQHQLTVLPDGSVLATGGSRNSNVNDRANAVLAAELWNPATQTWRTLSSGTVPRLYHSSATLLPDGRVALGGGGHPEGFGVAEFRAEVFSPPYLFKGARPTISSAPSQASHGQSFFLGTADGASITKLALIPQPTPTHAYNSNSGYVPLTFSQGAGGLNVTAPPNGNLAPPGMYMLFAINANGVPSVAKWVRIVPAAGGGINPTRLDARQDAWRPLASVQETTAPAAPAPVPAASSVFGTLTIGPSTSSENIGIATYGVRLLCTLDNPGPLASQHATRGPP